MDGLGLAIEFIGIVVFTWSQFLISHALNAEGDIGQPVVMSIGALALSFVGYAVRRVSRNEPILRNL